MVTAIWVLSLFFIDNNKTHQDEDAADNDTKIIVSTHILLHQQTAMRCPSRPLIIIMHSNTVQNF